MNSILPGSESVEVLVLTAALALAILAAAVLIVKKILKKKQFPDPKPKIADFPPQYRNFRSEINLIRRMIPPVQSQRIPKPSRSACNDIELIDGRGDITQSLLALVEKYSLDTFTIATSDGLVFASSGGDDAQTSAATYGMMELQDPDSKAATVIVPGLTHKGSALAGIIRTQHPLPEKIIDFIKKDTQTILNWWV